MTGYGTASAPVPGGRVVAEVRSVNARFLELKVNVPREHQPAEAELRAVVQKFVERGRVDVAIRREGAVASRVQLDIDVERARAYVGAWRKLKKDLGLPGDVDLSLLRASAGEVIRSMEQVRDPARELEAIQRALGRALAAHERERVREGAHLAADMRARITRLDELQRECARLADEIKPMLADRLSKRIGTLIGAEPPDPTRVLQEVALAVDRSDISEELIRLGSHLHALRGLTRERGAVGKRIEFLLQETLREINTIGSKANHLPLTQAVLAAKAELEKLREQVANVE
jgi:uncharacterized protein (TIGR00255 family)